MQSKCKAMQSNAKQIYTIGFCVYQRNYLIINKAVISFRYAVFIKLLTILIFLTTFVGTNRESCYSKISIVHRIKAKRAHQKAWYAPTNTM